MTVYFLSENPRTPLEAYDSGTLDLFFNTPLTSVEMHPGVTYEFDMGVKMYSHPAENLRTSVLIIPRSSASHLNKTRAFVPYADGSVKILEADNLTLANTVGLIDWDYRGPIKARVNVARYVNLEMARPYLQCVSLRPDTKFRVVSSLSEIPEEYLAPTTRGEKGFGSSDESKR